jgi:hypothetical protein
VKASEGRERTQGAVVSASTLRARFPPTMPYIATTLFEMKFELFFMELMIIA